MPAKSRVDGQLRFVRFVEQPWGAASTEVIVGHESQWSVQTA